MGESRPKGWFHPSEIPKICRWYNKCPFNRKCQRQTFLASPSLCYALMRLHMKGLIAFTSNDERKGGEDER
jgi:hypothetical protein